MSLIDNFQTVNNFFGMDLRTACQVIAALGIVHPMAYSCSFFMPLSYIMVTIWILLALNVSANVGLLCAVVKNDTMLISIYVWFSLLFIILMMFLLFFLGLIFLSRYWYCRAFAVCFGVAWYIVCIYFVIVVNSYRIQLQSKSKRSYLN